MSEIVRFPKEEGPVVGATRALLKQPISAQSAVAGLMQPRAAERGKRLATARARAALRGIALHALDDDRGRTLLVASVDGLTRSFSDLAEVEAWLDQVGT